MNVTNVTYNCSDIDKLPLKGGETLILACVYFLLIGMLCVTFYSVALKQLFPGKLLDPFVATQIAELQKKYPHIGEKQKEEDNEENSSSALEYDRVLSQDAYITEKTVDADLKYILANGSAFSSVSGYCSSTTRGYAMLSATLIAASLCLAFLWCQAALVDHRQDVQNQLATVALVGYIMLCCTGIVMCNPNGHAVGRDANICLFSSFPLRVGGKENPILKLHGAGVGCFVLLPMLAHGYQLYLRGDAEPNKAAFTGVVIQFVCTIAYLLSMKIPESKLPAVERFKISILLEIFCVESSLAAYAQFEFYPVAVCLSRSAGWGPAAPTYFNYAVIAVCLAPVAFVVQQFAWAPTASSLPPAVLLSKGKDAPVATAGAACPAMAWSAETAPGVVGEFGAKELAALPRLTEEDGAVAEKKI